jgi:hypothetical protein
MFEVQSGIGGECENQGGDSDDADKAANKDSFWTHRDSLRPSSVRRVATRSRHECKTLDHSCHAGMTAPPGELQVTFRSKSNRNGLRAVEKSTGSLFHKTAKPFCALLSSALSRCVEMTPASGKSFVEQRQQ